MASGDSDKTEKPTPKKLREARKEGNIARSQDVSAWLGLLAISAIVPALGRKAADDLQTLLVGATFVSLPGVVDSLVQRIGAALAAVGGG